MDEPLVDEQDFPRNDIDVYQIRLTRNRIICKHSVNDLNTIFKIFFSLYSIGYLLNHSNR